jgi:hypothetical protein
MFPPANVIYLFFPAGIGALLFVGRCDHDKPAASEFFLARYIMIVFNYVPSVRYLKTLAGNRKIDDAVLQKLNTLTREEARMAILY